MQALRDVHRGDSGTHILEEMGLLQGTVRVDIAVVNGSLAAFEIKSDADNLDRLPHQLAAYCRVFDFVTVAAGEAHLHSVLPMLPEACGLMVARWNGDSVVFDTAREARRNEDIDRFAMAQLLWRSEALAVLELRGLDAGVRSKPREALWQRLATELSVAELGWEVRSALRARVGWLADRSPIPNGG